jgi:hypothetical protein
MVTHKQKTFKTPKIHWHLTKEQFIFSLSFSQSCEALHLSWKRPVACLQHKKKTKIQ